MEDNDVVVHEDDSSSIGENILLENAMIGPMNYLIQEDSNHDKTTDKTPKRIL